MNLPTEDLPRWEQRLREDRPSVVLREMADAYKVDRGTLGFFMADLWPELGTPGVQVVWGWDLVRSGKGHSDEKLDALFAELRAEHAARVG